MVLKPISLAETDYQKLEKEPDEYIGMDDSYFEYLLSNCDKFAEDIFVDEELVNIDILSEENNAEIIISEDNVLEEEDIEFIKEDEYPDELIDENEFEDSDDEFANDVDEDDDYEQ